MPGDQRTHAALVIHLGELVELTVDELANLQQRQMPVGGQNLKAEFLCIVDALCAGTQEFEGEAGILPVPQARLSALRQLGAQTRRICHPQLVFDHQSKKLLQAPLYRLFVRRLVPIPIHHFVGKTFAAAAYHIADTGGAYTDTGRGNGLGHRNWQIAAGRLQIAATVYFIGNTGGYNQ